MLERKPIADWRAVVHQIDRIVLDAELRQQAVDDVGIVAESVGESLVIRHGALAEARIVWRDHMERSGERRNQIAEHVGRGRKPVQQQDCRSILWASIPIEDVEIIYDGWSYSV